jgi:hypothetical protein
MLERLLNVLFPRLHRGQEVAGPLHSSYEQAGSFLCDTLHTLPREVLLHKEGAIAKGTFLQ